LKDLLQNSGSSVILSGDIEARNVTDLFIDAGANTQAGEISRVTTRDVEASPFTWTMEAKLIREEIALLASISDATVQETSSIFELGLDSIDVIKLASRLKKQGVEIPVSSIIRSQSIAKMVPQIIAKANYNSQSSSKSIVQTLSLDLETYLKAQGGLTQGTVAVLPATPLQQSMVNEMINSNYHRYFNVEAFKLHSNINIPRLKEAVERVIAVSPILRTSFIKVDDPRSPVSYAQVVHKDHPGVSQSENETLEVFMDHFKTSSAYAAASDGSLYQVHILKAADNEFMIMAISHALYDGTSLRTLHADIHQAYLGKSSCMPWSI